jgi:hypothetical protein
MINDCVSVNNRALAESLAVPDLESSQISEAWLVTLVNMDEDISVRKTIWKKILFCAPG